MKVVVDRVTERMPGVHILGEPNGEMALPPGIGVKMGVTKAEFDATMALHPSAAGQLVTMRTRTSRRERDFAY